MGIAERREREKALRRVTILASAKEVAMFKGVERMSMEDIAEKAELAKATLYQYFPGKEAILNELCEESARGFLEHLKTLPTGSVSGIDAMRLLWQSYISMFGDSDEMLLVFRIRNYLASWPLADGQTWQTRSPYVHSIFSAIYAMIEQCKAEGIFDPLLNSSKALHLLLRLFSDIIEDTVGRPEQDRGSVSLIKEMTSTFQTVIRGFAKEGIEHAELDIGLVIP
jgi:AcrR family transcriptional regulator